MEEKGKNLMSRIPFKRHFVILVTCILAIGVIVPIATFAKSNNSEPHRRPLPTKSHVAKLASGGTSFSITTDANCNIGDLYLLILVLNPSALSLQEMVHSPHVLGGAMGEMVTNWEQ